MYGRKEAKQQGRKAGKADGRKERKNGGVRREGGREAGGRAEQGPLD